MADKKPAGDAKEQEVPASSFARPDPDSVLLDEGNPDNLLGADSDAEDAADQARKRLSKALELTSEMDANPAPGSTTYAAPKPNRASAVFTAGSTVPNEEQEDPRETIAALQAHIKDLTAQVTGLNGKLVGSFERVADLEDEFSEAQRKLQATTSKIQTLEKERSEHLAALNTGLLVEKSHVTTEMQRMMDRVMEETKQRGKAENDKKQIEEELEQLSASLFAEANRMVAVEKLARARAEEKSGSMEKGLKDTEGIMLEQQKVLASLQRQVEEMQQGGLTSDSASLMPGQSGLKIESLARSPSQRTATLGGSGGRRRTSVPAGMQILINIQPYSEFVAFMGHLRKQRRNLRHFYTYPLPGQSRAASPAPALIAAGATSTVGAVAGGQPTMSPSPSQGSLNPFSIAGVSRHKDYPSLPSSAENLVQLTNQGSLPFIKRAQEEDSDPCLRLDLAPGLNWLTRRQANTAILEGNLVVEPIFPGGSVPDADEIRAQNAHLPPAACALCGALVVNVPLGGGTENGTHGPEGDHQKQSGGWASSFSAVTGSAATSMLEAAGVRDKSKSASGSISSTTATEKAERDTSGSETPTAARSRSTGLFSGLRLGAASPKPEKSTTSSLAQRLPGLTIGSSQSENEDNVS